MKIQHAYCTGQHKSAIDPVADQLRVRGHEVVEVRLKTEDVNQRCHESLGVDVSGCSAFLASFPRILRMGASPKGPGYKQATGVKFSIEHGVNPIAWAWPIERHVLYDWCLLAGKWQMDAALRSKYAKELGPKCIVTGWPKADALVGVTAEARSAAKRALAAKIPLDLGHPVVAFVPTHGAAYIRADALRKLKLKNLVIAPHDGTYVAFHGAEFEINYANEYPLYVETNRIAEVLLAADIVISDFSSAVLEASLLDVPIIQLLESVKLHMRASADPVRDGYYHLSQGDTRKFRLGPNLRPSEIREIPRLIEIGLKEDLLPEERRFWRDEIFSFQGKATENVCSEIERLAS